MAEHVFVSGGDIAADLYHCCIVTYKSQGANLSGVSAPRQECSSHNNKARIAPGFCVSWRWGYFLTSRASSITSCPPLRATWISLAEATNSRAWSELGIQTAARK